MIQWQLIGEAMTFYEGEGYSPVSTPWVVPRHISQLTYTGESISCQLGDLVGSAEQGFLTLPDVKDAKLVSCTPCFRSEPVTNALTRDWFMKVELYRQGQHLDAVLADAERFFYRQWIKYLSGETLKGRTWRNTQQGYTAELKRRKTFEGVDIELGGIEIGSYGIRQTEDREWTYGTGLALPRFTEAARRCFEQSSQ